MRDIICGHCGTDMQTIGRELRTPCDCWSSGGINPPEWLLRETEAEELEAYKSARGAIKQQPTGTAEAVIREMRDEQ